MTDAYHDGRLTDERLSDALHRILGLKAILGLDHFSMDQFPSKDGLSIIGCPEHKQVAEEVSDRSITFAKQVGPNIFPVTAKKYPRILLVPVGPVSSPTLAMAGMGADGSKLTKNLKSELEAKGFHVEIYEDPVQKMMGMIEKMTVEQVQAMEKQFSAGQPKVQDKGAYGHKQSIAALRGSYDLVINVANVSSTMTTTQRLSWAVSKGGWDNPWYVNDIPEIFVSFNCPFHLADVPQVKNYINCYDAQDSSVVALVRKLTGLSPFTGISTVDVFCGMMDTKF